MKTIIKTTIILLTFLSCTSKDTKQLDQKLPQEAYDTIRIDLDSIDENQALREERYERMGFSELIDSLKMITSNREIKELKESAKVFGNHKDLEKFYRYNIPGSIYERIFPHEKISISRTIIQEKTVDETSKKVYLKKYAKIEEQRKYKSLYALVKKERYLQLVFTKEGKYMPELELLTVSTDNLEKIGSLNLYGGIYDSYDIDYWVSEFSENHEKIKITHVINRSLSKVNLDTIYSEYRITKRGKIIKVK